MIATSIPTPALRATVEFAQGVLAAASADHERAREHLEDAVDLFDGCGTPVECVRARLELARSLLALGQPGAAEREIRAVRDCAREVGAALEGDQASRLLAAPGQPLDDAVSALTARQLDVIRLVAEGLSDKDIATRLVLSEHTVHRHIANIYTRLGCSSRAAAVAHAGRLGLV